ncbi:MAG: hypothetical protein ACC663_09100, partial [Gammaproteobacteria bacterium]
MKHSTKAALLSALGYPGAGHLYLKHYISGALLAGAASVSLYLIVVNLVAQAQQIVDKIFSGEVGLDIAAITEAVSRQSGGDQSQLLNIAWTVLIVSWLVATVDA